MRFPRPALLAVLVALGLARAASTATPIAPTERVGAAMTEILGRLPPGVVCRPGEAWTVAGDLESAAEFLAGELESRGWPVLQHGQLSLSYAVLADPDPSDPAALALGGLMDETTEAASSVVFLDRCNLPAEPQPAAAGAP